MFSALLCRDGVSGAPERIEDEWRSSLRLSA
jgi:hypothetical protein